MMKLVLAIVSFLAVPALSSSADAADLARPVQEFKLASMRGLWVQVVNKGLTRVVPVVCVSDDHSAGGGFERGISLVPGKSFRFSQRKLGFERIFVQLGKEPAQEVTGHDVRINCKI